MMMIFWILGIVLLMYVCWLVLNRSSWPTRFWSTPQDSAEEIIRRRYARGEIDHETYERMLRDLGPRAPRDASA